MLDYDASEQNEISVVLRYLAQVEIVDLFKQATVDHKWNFRTC